MLNFISAEEKLGMAKYIRQYAFQHNIHTSEPQAPIDYVLREWNDQKKDLFKAFGGNLILERKFSLTKGQKEMEHTMSNRTYQLVPYSFVSSVYALTNAGGFYEYDNRIRHLVDIPTLVKNVWDEEDFNLILPNKLRPLRVQRGMKIIKILAKIAAAHNLEYFEEFRIAHSMALNDNMREGVMRLSIHPFDYMTMSDSCYNWTSCMEWDGGEYRAGTVEMMNSPFVVVAYIKGKENEYCNDFMWPGKKWRELFLVNDKLISNVKAYPYASDSLTRFALDWLKELVEKNTDWHYVPEVFEYNAFSWSGSFFEPLNQRICICPGTERMYNDFSDEQLAYVSADIESNYSFSYSGREVCMWCGSKGYGILPDETCIVCGDCETSTRCDDCGEVIYDEVYELEGYHYCSYCYNNNARICEISGTVRHEEYIEYLYLSPDGGKTIWTDTHISVDMDEYIHHSSSNKSDPEWCRYFKCERPQMAVVSPPEQWWERTRYYVLLEDLTEEGVELFDAEDAQEWHLSTCEEKNYSYEAQKTVVDF